jgi:hypothetical protein
MKYRPLGPDGDYTVGVPFLTNSPACVGQAVQTRLLLYLAEWFLDTTDGTPWFQSIVGRHPNTDPNSFVKQRIIETPNVTSIVSFTGAYDGPSRKYTMTSVINTAYGITTVTIGT